jgi:hypothetical protein
VQRTAGDVRLIAVGFDPAPVLADVADAVGWRGAFLADVDGRLYRRLGLRRAPWWRVWSPRTLLFYSRAARGAEASPGEPAPPSDVRQMGGDAVVVDGVAVVCWRPRTPVDRVDPVALCAAAAR